jgi:hypothetical protein
VASEELKIRAQIDQENVKAVLLINGGGAIALLAFLPTVLGKPQFDDLTRSIVSALLIYQAGLALAVVHNYLRRKCSQIWQSHGYNPPRCKFFGHQFKGDPCLCMWSWLTISGSLAAFMAAGVVVASGGFAYLDTAIDVLPLTD